MVIGFFSGWLTMAPTESRCSLFAASSRVSGERLQDQQYCRRSTGATSAAVAEDVTPRSAARGCRR